MIELAQYFFGNFWHWLLATVWLLIVAAVLARKTR
jgi:hypothetical protein